MKNTIKSSKKEIIVSLCCIMFLLMNIAAIGNSGRMRAKEMVCLLNLSNWGRVFERYVNDNNGNFNTRYGNGGRWFNTICDYTTYGNMNLCPMASTPANPDGDMNTSWWGSTFRAWGKIPEWDTGGGRPAGAFGSYGANGYIYVPSEDPLYKPAKRFWRTPYVDGASDIPMLMGCFFWDGWPDDDDTPPELDGSKYHGDDNAMNRFCLNRHDGGVNCVFMDFSARKVGLKELWTLNWHRGFNRANAWTLAGGITTEHWAMWGNGWMANFKNY
jgi:hypothetical protein